MTVTIRAATPADIDAIVVLCAEHAAYERAESPAPDLGVALQMLLFDEARAFCAVAECDGVLAGYATWSREFSTWRGTEYAHLDCLYLREEFRNRGIGALLMQHVADAAAGMRLPFMEWQTPHWNEDAIRFYGRSGATASRKVRYHRRL